MFDVFASSSQAYHQVGLFVAALVCFGVGALLVGSTIYLNIVGWRVSGTIIGVVARGDKYAPVYRYLAPNGLVREAQSSISSNSLAGNDTGRVVPLLVSPHNPARFSTLNVIMTALGGGLLLLGFGLGYVALTAYRVTPMTWIMAAGLLIWLGWRLWRGFIPRAQRPSIAEWRKQRGLGEDARVDLAQVKSVEQIETMAAKATAQPPRMLPFIVFAAGLAALAILQGVTVGKLQMAGLRAEGRVVRLVTETGSGNSPSYYPVVRYRTERDTVVEFKDSTGSNPPGYRAGDVVTVLYLADRPQQAMIDRGLFWNWLIPALLAFGAVLVLWLARAMRRRANGKCAVTADRLRTTTPKPQNPGSS